MKRLGRADEALFGRIFGVGLLPKQGYQPSTLSVINGPFVLYHFEFVWKISATRRRFSFSLLSEYRFVADSCGV
jgi:hypothetical protein